MTEAVIVSTARTPLCKSWRGAFNMTHGATLGAHAVRHAVSRAGIDSAEVEDVIMGCANPEGATGGNIARQIALRAGLPVTTAGITVNRFCSSGLQSIAMASQRIIAGEGGIYAAGGVESISCVQNEMNKHMAREDWLTENKPELYWPMLQTAETVAKRYDISRERQDEYGARSQQARAPGHLSRFRRGGLRARRDGHRPRVRRAEAPQARGIESGGRRTLGAERGLCRAGDLLPRPSGHPRREAERQRRSDRGGPSLRDFRRAPRGSRAHRRQAPGREARRGDDVHRRRDGGGRPVRAGLGREELCGAARLFDLGSRSPYHLGPFHHFVVDEGPELLRGPGGCDRALLQEPFSHLRLNERLVHFAVDAQDDVFRRAFGEHDAEPRRHLVARDPGFLHRGQVG